MREPLQSRFLSANPLAASLFFFLLAHCAGLGARPGQTQEWGVRLHWFQRAKMDEEVLQCSLQGGCLSCSDGGLQALEMASAGHPWEGAAWQRHGVVGEGNLLGHIHPHRALYLSLVAQKGSALLQQSSPGLPELGGLCIVTVNLPSFCQT